MKPISIFCGQEKSFFLILKQMQENVSCIMEGINGPSQRQLVFVLIIRIFYGATVG